MSLARRVLGNTFVQIFGKLATAAMSIVIIKLITTYLGRAGYGEYTTVYEFIALFAVIADLGIFQIAVREMSLDRARMPEILGHVLSIRSLLALIALGIATGVAFLVPKYAGTPIPLGIAITTVTTFLALVTSTLSSVLQVTLKMERAVLASIVGKSVSLAYMVWVVFFFSGNETLGFWHLLFAGIAGNAVMLLLTYFFVRSITEIHFRFDWNFWRALLWKAIPYGAAILLATVYFRLGILLLSFLRNSEEVGVYGVAVRILENLQFISLFLLNSLLPIITRLLLDDVPKLRQLLQYAFDFLILLALPLVIGGVVLAYPLVALVASPEFLSRLGENFYGSDIALQILLGATLFAFLGNLFGFTLLAGNEQKKLLAINAVAVALNLGLNFLLIPLLGFRGAALTSVACEVFVCFGTYYYVRRLTGFRMNFIVTAKAAFAASVMGLGVWALEPFTFQYFANKGLFVLIPLGGIIYGALLLLLRTITPEMRALVRKRETPLAVAEVHGEEVEP